jgi:acyl-[acyl-carrier-protein]-phospholipid O-acyltransferase/long-chain-fatty-acid--[acyl-carrier-protein] ligase
VCIFAEGAISRIGQLLSFRPGLERIMKDSPAPIIPMYLDQLWGSIFSFKEGRFFWKLPKEIPYPVTVNIGAPILSNTPAQRVRRRIQELSADAFARRPFRYQLLHLGFLSQCKKTPFRRAIADSLGQDLSYSQLLTAVLLLRKRLIGSFERGERVGVLLPPSAAGAMANLSILALGAVPVNLNHTASKESFERMLEKAGIKKILTAESYREKIGLEEMPQMIRVESLLRGSSGVEKALTLTQAIFLPQFLLRKMYFDARTTRDDLCTVMFSSGTTGDPKGVMLTHGNICSNIESIYELLQLRRGDVILGSLPLFHSFGFTGTLFLPLLGGIPVIYHPNPVDAQQVTKLIRNYRASMLLTTPTFLQLYARKAKKEDLASLRYLVVGAEKLREAQRVSFEEKFGICPLEGYGCTELSPVAFVNVPDFGDGKGKQLGNKPGTVGQPIPGVTVKIVHPDTLEEMPDNEAGLLLVKGPNVMKGYLNDEKKTAEVLRDGYYVTGDIALIDDDGFITIKDRLSRFSKIGGEMVPHIKIEDELHAIIQSDEQVLAVTAVEDEKKGERLIVLTTVEFERGDVLARLGEKGLPNLWIPKAEDILKVDALPVLGTGKLDLKGLKELAKQLMGLL